MGAPGAPDAMTDLSRKEGWRSYNDMCLPSSRTFTPETVTAWKTSLFWLKSPEGAPLLLNPSLLWQTYGCRGAHASQSKLLHRSPRQGAAAAGAACGRHCCQSQQACVALDNPHPCIPPPLFQPHPRVCPPGHRGWRCFSEGSFSATLKEVMVGAHKSGHTLHPKPNKTFF